MELHTYYTILRRWWWLALIPTIIIGLVGVATFRRAATTYSTKIRFSASTPPAFESAPGFDPTYYSWLTSEYIVGSLSDWTKTSSFAQAVSDELSKQGKNISASTIQGSLASDYVRSQLTLYINGATADDVSAIANAAITVLQTRNASVFPPTRQEQRGCDSVRRSFDRIIIRWIARLTRSADPTHPRCRRRHRLCLSRSLP